MPELTKDEIDALRTSAKALLRRLDEVDPEDPKAREDEERRKANVAALRKKYSALRRR